jgi:hypothetical protein
MLEVLQRRNFSETTIRSYFHGIAHFSRTFAARPISLDRRL